MFADFKLNYGLGIQSNSGITIRPNAEFFDFGSDTQADMLRQARDLYPQAGDLVHVWCLVDNMGVDIRKRIDWSHYDQDDIDTLERVISENQFADIVDFNNAKFLLDSYRKYIDRKASGPVSKALRNQVIARDGKRCRYCSKMLDVEPVQIDHVTPRVMGGKTVLNNLVAACKHCNSTKHARTPEMAGMQLLPV